MAGFPAVVARNAAWPDHTNAQLGPFLANVTPVLAWGERDPTETQVVNFGTGSGTEYVAQAFQIDPTDRSPSCSTVTLSLQWVGTQPVDNAVVELQSDAAGVPSGTVLASIPLAATSIQNTTWTQTGLNRYWATFTFSTQTLQPATQYWVVLHRDGVSSATAYWRWFKAAATAPADATRPRATKAYGGSWVVTTGVGEQMAVRVYETTNTPALHLPVIDPVAGTVQMRRSLDGGQTWPAIETGTLMPTSAVAGMRCLGVAHDAAGALIGIVYGDNVGTLTMRAYQILLGEWRTTVLTTPSLAANVSGTAAAWVARRAGNVMVSFQQAATELVSGTNYRRINLSWGSTSLTTHDVISGTTTPAGTQVHYDARFMTSDGNVRCHCFWTQSDDAAVHTRRFETGNTWAAAQTCGTGSATSNSAAYPLGVGVGFIVAGAQWVAILYVDGSTTKLARCLAPNTHTLANWSIETVLSTDSEVTTSNPGSVFFDGGTRLYVMRAVPSTRLLEYTQDKGASAWLEASPWRGATQPTVGGLTARGLATNRIGVVYVDQDGVLVYDQMWSFLPKQSRAVGTYTSTIVDTRVDPYSGQNPFTIALDNDLAVGVSANVTLFTGDTPTDPSVEKTQLGTDGTDSYGEAVAGDVGRYMKAVLTLSGTMVAGAVGY